MHLFYGVVLIAAGAAVVAVGRSAARGRLGRNHVARIRSRQTPADDESWRIVHEAAEPWSLAGGLALTLGGLVALGAEDEAVAAMVAALAAVFGIALVVAGAIIGLGQLRHRSD
ncbi:hypothetical protein SMC26_16195 [Actinomadura fulvescens]|uniref:SdpI family protein n=1 Tax=Actinomadura fulvescens TaxID=46160 RepID=A0ABN3QWD9_9ACTN